MNSNPKLSYAIAAILSGSGMGTATALAATATDTSATESDSIQEITVTAQRRAQNLQNVPIAVTYFSAEQLANQQITTTEDLERMVPNMFAANNVGQGSANVYYLRGLGQTQLAAISAPNTAANMTTVAVGAPIVRVR